MPIEPTSVSKPQVREIESTSANFGSWTSMQGSSTGGKDRPVASIWEKAINGAQKLFGSASSDTATLDESSENEDSSVESRGEGDRATSTFNSATGFSNRRFGSFGGAAWGGNTFGSVATSRAAPESFQTDTERSGGFDRPVEEKGAHFSSNEKPGDLEKTPARELPAKETPVVEDELDEDGAAKAKIAEVAANLTRSRNIATVQQSPAQPVAPTPVEAAALPQTAVAAAGTVQNPVPQVIETLSQNQAPVSPNTPQSQVGTAAQAAASHTSLAQVSPGAQAVKAPETPLSEGANAQAATQTSAASQRSKNESTGQSPVAQPAVAKPIADQDNADAKATVAKPLVATTDDGSKKTDIPVAQTSTDPVAKPVGDAAQKEVAAGKESLGFDLSKAKDTISDALGKVAAKPTATPAQPAAAPVAQAPVAPAPAATEPAKGQSAENGQIRLPDGVGGEAKDASAMELSKKEFALSAHQRTAAAKASVDATAGQSRSNAADVGVVDAKSTQATPGVPAGQFSRETAAAAGRMQAAGTSQGKGTTSTAQHGPSQTALNAVAGGQGLATGVTTQGAGQQGQPQNSEGESAAKQEFGAALKQATSAKGAEKVADGSESFEIKTETAATRRGEAASKVRQTSYVSKTAEEVKEVIATLTKSIDRLVTDKSGAMNLKINFEGGGSLKLSVSMEGGQVVTSMQTDVAGLEGAIKSNWAELANDWNQKGLKLNTPQFQNSEAGKDSSFENLSEFSSKQDRQADGRSGDGRGQGSSRTATRGFSSGGSAENGTASAPSSEAKPEVVSDKELKTYA